MGIAAYNRGSQAISDSITRATGGRVDGDYPSPKRAQRPANWGAKALKSAVNSARSIVDHMGGVPDPTLVDMLTTEGRHTRRAAERAVAQLSGEPKVVLTNRRAAELVADALRAGLVLSLQSPNGEALTVGRQQSAVPAASPAFAVIRWGRSRFADPCGRVYGAYSAAEAGQLTLEHSNRGAAARAARTAIDAEVGR